MPFPRKAVFLTFIGVFFVLLPLLAICGSALSAAFKSTRVTVSPQFLRVEQKGLLFSKKTEIPASELEELNLGRAPPPAAELKKLKLGNSPLVNSLISAALSGGRGIVARSDRTSITFGGSLSPEERRYLHALIKTVLTV